MYSNLIQYIQSFIHCQQWFTVGTWAPQYDENRSHCHLVCRVFQIRWLLEDEIVSALRHSCIISSSTLQKVTQHILSSSGRPHCHCEDVPLQFVFGPEQSMEKFKEARIQVVPPAHRSCYVPHLQYKFNGFPKNQKLK